MSFFFAQVLFDLITSPNIARVFAVVVLFFCLRRFYFISHLERIYASLGLHSPSSSLRVVPSLSPLSPLHRCFNNVYPLTSPALRIPTRRPRSCGVASSKAAGNLWAQSCTTGAHCKVIRWSRSPPPPPPPHHIYLFLLPLLHHSRRLVWLAAPTIPATLLWQPQSHRHRWPSG